MKRFAVQAFNYKIDPSSIGRGFRKEHPIGWQTVYEADRYDSTPAHADKTTTTVKTPKHGSWEREVFKP